MTVTALHPVSPAPAAPTDPEVPRSTIVYSPAPAGAAADLPRVFQVIHSVMRDVMPVAKDQENKQQNYSFRGVDDAMSAMAGPMRAHGCFIAPEIVEHYQRPRGEKGTHTNIRMRYRIFGPAGDCIAVTIPGEAMDQADKSTNKAMSAALKYMLFQVFMIPVDSRSVDDSDRDGPPAEHRAERQQNQQRRQQRQQNQQRRQQQGGQQPRRSNRAEPGPWEQQAPAQQQRRDYLAEAQAAPNPGAFGVVREAAVQAGAPPEYVAQLDQIAEAKRKTAQQQGGQQPRPPYDDGHRHPDEGHRTAPDAPRMERAPDPADEAAEAENRLRLAASKANLPTLDRDFEMALGLPIAQAPTALLNLFRERIEAAGGAQ
ncbi:ERF family protein [Streptomyces sp. NPDC085942]|uniref:ERF family protein n=1 Tax=Streptomyces sp. NPDC085942 TaxID=3365743 RepID=UPI0037D17254